MKNAGDESLVGDTFSKSALLESVEILGRDSDVDTPVLLKGRCCVLLVAGNLGLAIRYRPPLSGLDGIEQLFLVLLEFAHSEPPR
jgi:hypothetical protein